MLPTGDLTRNPGMCPNQELNWRPFRFWDDTQPAQPHQSVQESDFWLNLMCRNQTVAEPTTFSCVTSCCPQSTFVPPGKTCAATVWCYQGHVNLRGWEWNSSLPSSSNSFQPSACRWPHAMSLFRRITEKLVVEFSLLIFLEVFCSYVHQGNWPVIFFSVVSLSGFG